MSIDFFKAEVKKAQDRFNQTFGKETVCDLKLRQTVILAICFLSNEARKISNAANEDEVRAQIKKFMRTKTTLNKLFVQFELESQERSEYARTQHYKNQQRNLRKHINGQGG